MHSYVGVVLAFLFLATARLNADEPVTPATPRTLTAAAEQKLPTGIAAFESIGLQVRAIEVDRAKLQNLGFDVRSLSPAKLSDSSGVLGLIAALDKERIITHDSTVKVDTIDGRCAIAVLRWPGQAATDQVPRHRIVEFAVEPTLIAESGIRLQVAVSSRFHAKDDGVATSSDDQQRLSATVENAVAGEITWLGNFELKGDDALPSGNMLLLIVSANRSQISSEAGIH